MSCRGGESLENVRAEGRGRRDADGRIRPRRGSASAADTASASLRASSVVRSMISVPSRWSSSCCSDARRMTLELEPQIVALGILSLERHAQVPLDRQP